MLNTKTQAFLEQLRSRIAAAQSRAAEKEVQRIKADIAVPYPPSSSPGEPPHRRTGNLRDGVQQQTEEEGEQVRTTVLSNRVAGDLRVPMFLEFGTMRMHGPRPFMRPSKDRATRSMLSQIASEMTE